MYICTYFLLIRVNYFILFTTASPYTQVSLSVISLIRHSAIFQVHANCCCQMCKHSICIWMCACSFTPCFLREENNKNNKSPALQSAAAHSKVHFRIFEHTIPLRSFVSRVQAPLVSNIRSSTHNELISSGITAS